MNRYIAIGHLTRDPELHSMGDSQRQACDMRVAVSNGKDRDPTYVDVSTFDASARACARYLRKGSRVGVDGRLISRQWEAEDGSKRSKLSVIGRVEFLTPKPGSDASPNHEPAAEAAGVGAGSDDDVPF